jgi:hypothetical protein
MKTTMKAWLSMSNDSDGSLSENAATSGNIDPEKVTTAPLQRRLQPRHLQMLAIGGTVGTGLVCEILTAGHWTRMYMLSVLIVIVGRSCLTECKSPLLTIESSSDPEALLPQQGQLEHSLRTPSWALLSFQS